MAYEKPAAASTDADRVRRVAEFEAAEGGSFPIVGIGSSAGGLEALEEFFDAMPDTPGMALIVVVHLDPHHASILPDLIQRHTALPVRQIEGGEEVRCDTVYVIPPNKALTISDGRLSLAPPPLARGLNLPIDMFFRSLAEDCGGRAIGIVLSGSGSDGSEGLRAIKGELGLTLAQDKESAAFPSMPASAVATGATDHVLAPGRMPEQLQRYARHERERAVPGDADPFDDLVPALPQIFAVLRVRTEHDFSRYKKNTICRRIERRMGVHQISSPLDYVRYLEQSERETQILFKELLIGVTSFFRNPEAFEVLQRSVIPQVLAVKPEDSPVRVWVPGCSTGEEAYTLAIVLHECIEQAGRRFQVQIFGTDLDREAIETARTGVYPASIVADLGRERLRKYFTRGDDGRYRIRNRIREMLVFANQNLIKDPPFTKLDILSCRNLLIYLGAELQRRLLPVFHYSLRPEGVLILGSSETVGQDTDLFKLIDKKWKIFQRMPLVPGAYTMMEFPTRPKQRPPADTGPSRPVRATDDMSALQMVESILEQSGAAPCAVINDDLDVIYIHGRTGRYLEPAEGKASVNIADMARPGLKRELLAAVRQVATSRREVTCRNLKIAEYGTSVSLHLSVRPLPMRKLMLVTFEETEAADDATAPSGRSKAGGKKRKHPTKTNEELEIELRATRENLQTTIEELETANEELKSTNEELQSTNEELQSTNEELETSKEELQSLNEESVTVNAELQARVDQMVQVNDDMKNLLDSTEIATVFLDTELCVRRFTPPATSIIPLNATDRGRPISHLATRLIDTDLAVDGAEVLEDLAVREKEVKSREGRFYTMRIRPYRTISNVIDGVVITFEDSTERKAAETALAGSETMFRMLFELASDSMMLLAVPQGGIAEFNRNAHERLGYTRDQFGALTIEDIENAASPRRFKQALGALGDDENAEFDAELQAKDGHTSSVRIKARSIQIDQDQFVLVAWQDGERNR